jgi:hypothetical protein
LPRQCASVWSIQDMVGSSATIVFDRLGPNEFAFQAVSPLNLPVVDFDHNCTRFPLKEYPESDWNETVKLGRHSGPRSRLLQPVFRCNMITGFVKFVTESTSTCSLRLWCPSGSELDVRHLMELNRNVVGAWNEERPQGNAGHNTKHSRLAWNCRARPDRPLGH